ncbi:VWA domain-containing protein [Jatrophihabitans telluris]|uniref:VWA domain-containing protein n=1 Tax=Jatrophihabitans telluris TaxID=2038343 RepID=A0ABY4R421_9ACTN|nr:VWA domain-containing protein [Jatrophihabitans telluris]UQX90212.1 VWA domain-containing protein [Jatrophihabitans telluris]
MHFASPMWLFLLLAVAAVGLAYVLLQLRRRTFVARFSNASLLASVVPRRPGWRRHLTFALLLIAMTVLSLGVARPTAAVRVPQERATVMLAIDVSLSMQATDVLPNRLDAAKKAAQEFSDLLPRRINLGLVKFGRNGSVLIPPTQDRTAFKRAVDGLQLEPYTAIGEGVFSCLDALQNFNQASSTPNDKPAPSRIVLLSDGSNTIGRSVAEAATAAKKANTPVSTIAFGTENGTVTVDGQTTPVRVDKATLRSLAQSTGGTFHSAASAEELKSVYQDIGSQIGYTTAERDISWRFMLVGLLAMMGAGAVSLLWSGRLS